MVSDLISPFLTQLYFSGIFTSKLVRFLYFSLTGSDDVAPKNS